MNHPLLEIKELKKHFPITGGLFGKEVGRVYAVDGVSLTLHKGQTIGLVGESGCGKSTLGRTILRLYEPTSGSILIDGIDITTLKGSDMQKCRRDLQIVFQDPFSSLNPRMTVGNIIAEPMKIHKLGDAGFIEKEVVNLLGLVGLRPDAKDRYPHEFSGGQRQRIGIARALSLKPKIIIADEPVSALDVSVQSQILNLMVDLRQQFDLSYIFIAHDLSVIQHISDVVAVMYLGKIVEYASSDELYQNPMHPYTKALISAIPKPIYSETREKRQILTGDVPSPINPPKGCHFSPRCPIATDKCRAERPELKNYKSETDQHLVSCHYV